MNFLKKLLSCVKRTDVSYDETMIKGYSPREIELINKFYDVNIQPGQDLYDFLICMGRCSGGLFTSYDIEFYHAVLGINHSYHIEAMFELLKKFGRSDLLLKKPFYIAPVSLESDESFYFILTDSETPNAVYLLYESDSTIRIVDDSFFSYLHEGIDYSFSPRNLLSINRGDIIYEKDKYRNDKYKFLDDLLKLCKKKPDFDYDSIKGYSSDEINRMVKTFYSIEKGNKIEGQLFDFLKLMGKSSGGLINKNPLFIYDASISNINVYKHIYMINKEYIWNNDFKSDLSLDFDVNFTGCGRFYLSFEQEKGLIYYMVTVPSPYQDNLDLMWCIDINNKKIFLTNITLMEYLAYVIDEYYTGEIFENNVYSYLD